MPTAKPLLSVQHPLWVPEGSVRSLIAITITAGYLFSVVADEVLFLVLGFYFGSRSAASS